MSGEPPYLVPRCRAWLATWWRRRWRLTRRGRVVVGSLGVLLFFFISSLVGSSARDPPHAKGLPMLRSRARPRSQLVGGAAGRGFTLIASGDVLTHGPVLQQARAYGRRVSQPYDFRPMFADIRPLVAGADLALCHLEVPPSRDGHKIPSAGSAWGSSATPMG